MWSRVVCWSRHPVEKHLQLFALFIRMGKEQDIIVWVHAIIKV